MKKLDKTFEIIDAELQEIAAKQGKMKPYLDAALYKVMPFDNKINWHEAKIKELEAEKQIELRKLGELFDTAMVNSHTLKKGYTAKTDDKREIKIENIGKFMKWLKENKKPHEVFSFLEGAIGKVKIRSFCNKEANKQRAEGEIEPKIGGIDFGEVTYRRLTTCTIKEKKCKQK